MIYYAGNKLKYCVNLLRFCFKGSLSYHEGDAEDWVSIKNSQDPENFNWLIQPNNISYFQEALLKF